MERLRGPEGLRHQHRRGRRNARRRLRSFSWSRDAGAEEQMPVEATASLQKHLSEAQRATRTGNREQARTHFEAVIAIDSEEPTARNWLGADALARADADAAAIHFEIACKRQPRERSHWLNLASAYRALGDA